jgi:hypothetical protein
VLSELVAHLFMTTLSDLGVKPLDSMDAALAAAPLPHPMILNNWESKTDRQGSGFCTSNMLLCMNQINTPPGPDVAVTIPHYRWWMVPMPTVVPTAVISHA